MFVKIFIHTHHYWLKILGGVIMLLFWFIEDYRSNKYLKNIASYKNALNQLNYLDLEKNIIQCLIVPTQIVGVSINRMRQVINNYVSYNETLINMYGLKPTEGQINYKDKLLHEYFTKTKEYYENKDPTGILSDQEQKELVEYYEMSKELFHKYYKEEIFKGIIDLDNYNTEKKLMELEKNNNKIKSCSTILFVIGNILLWFA